MSRGWPAVALLLALLSSGCPGPTTPKVKDKLAVLPGALDPRVLLAAPVQKARAAGAGELEPIGVALVSEGEQLGSFVRVPSGECALALASPGPTVRDVDLFVFSEAGDVLAADESPKASAAVMVCPPHPRRIYVAARVVGGTGLLALGVLPVPPTAADRVAAAVEVRGRPGQDTGKLAAWPGLERKLRERREALGSSWQDVRRVALTLDPDAYATVSQELDARRCLDVFVVPSDDLSGVEVQVLDGQGRVVGRARAPARDRGLTLCSQHRQELSVLVRPRVARGLAAVVIARSPEGSAAELYEEPWTIGLGPLADLDAERKRHRERLSKLRLSKPTEVGRGSATVAAPLAFAAKLPKGCARYDVVGGVPLGGIEARLWATDGQELDAATGGSTATLFACGPHEPSIEVTALDAGGPVVVEARRDETPPELLVKHPLAGGRLLSRLEASWGPADPKMAASVTAIELQAGKRERLVRRVAVRSCLEWIAAAGGSLAGLSLRSGSTHARGEHVASLRACAATEPRDVQIDVVADRGVGTVLLLGVPER